jgi:Lrp/AsnC family leucine-responsive transcriptional regulator
MIAKQNFATARFLMVNPKLDAIDRKILKLLQADGRLSNVDLAAKVHLSPPQCMRRVRALEDCGAIRGYRAMVDAEQIGMGVTAYVNLNIHGDSKNRVRDIERLISSFPQIVECYAVSGDFDYLLRVSAPDLRSLGAFLTDQLQASPGVMGVRSMIVLEEIKASSPLPLEGR